LLVQPKAASIGSAIKVSITVKNTGKRAGNESVQLYVNDLVASIAPPGKRLRRFAKVHLEPGQSKTLLFTLTSNDLSFIGAQNKPIVEPGDFDVMIGGQTQRFTLSQAP
jgi:beta-glucosidase